MFSCSSGLNGDITDLAKEVHEVLSTLDTYKTPEQTKRTNKHQFFLNSSNKKAKSVTLHIQGLDGTVSVYISLIVHVKNTIFSCIYLGVLGVCDVTISNCEGL